MAGLIDCWRSDVRIILADAEMKMPFHIVKRSFVIGAMICVPCGSGFASGEKPPVFHACSVVSQGRACLRSWFAHREAG